MSTDRDGTKSEARIRAEALVAERGLDWHGYDCENLVSDVVCDNDPELLRELLRIYVENGRSVQAQVYAGDDDNVTAFELARGKPRLQLVLQEFGIEVFRPCRPRSHGPLDDGYEDYLEDLQDGTWTLRNAIADVAELAYEMHSRDTAPREGSGLPYITHPAHVVKMLTDWGYSERADPVIVALGWAHDLKEDTSVTDEQIVKAGGAFGKQLLAGVNALTFETYAQGRGRESVETEEEHCARKAAYVQRVADGEVDFLAVKIADRICNTMERAETEPTRALQYLLKGEALFARIDELKHGNRIRATLDQLRNDLTVRHGART